MTISFPHLNNNIRPLIDFIFQLYEWDLFLDSVIPDLLAFFKIEKLAFFAQNRHFRRPFLVKKFSHRGSFFVCISNREDKQFRKGQLFSSKKPYFLTPYTTSSFTWLHIMSLTYSPSNLTIRRNGVYQAKAGYE